MEIGWVNVSLLNEIDVNTDIQNIFQDAGVYSSFCFYTSRKCPGALAPTLFS